MREATNDWYLQEKRSFDTWIGDWGSEIAEALRLCPQRSSLAWSGLGKILRRVGHQNRVFFTIGNEVITELRDRTEL